jgi:hypothetical protein
VVRAPALSKGAYYAAAKRELAAREWKYGQRYADAKTAVIGEVIARAEAPQSQLSGYVGVTNQASGSP